MKDECFVSVIVPVYNTANYLKACLDSILRYDHNIEVICVNDGSTDNSLDICNEYKQKDSRVRVINQENKGVSVARNVGIESASGRWIMFVDSDDTVTKNYYAAVEKLEDDSDIGLFAFDWIGKDNSCILDKTAEYNCKDKSLLVSKMLKSELLSENSRCSLRSPCAKAYKNEFLKKCKIRFKEDVIIGEDFIFNIYIYSLAKKIQFIPIVAYNCYIRDDSATHRFVPDMIEREIMFQKALKKALIDNDLAEDVVDDYHSEIKSGIMRCLRKQIFSGNYSRKEQLEMLNRVLENELFKSYFQEYDDNFRRNVILFLAKNKLLGLLEFIFRLEKMKNIM